MFISLCWKNVCWNNVYVGIIACWKNVCWKICLLKQCMSKYKECWNEACSKKCMLNSSMLKNLHVHFNVCRKNCTVKNVQVEPLLFEELVQTLIGIHFLSILIFGIANYQLKKSLLLFLIWKPQHLITWVTSQINEM